VATLVPVDFTWYDGGIKPQRPAELLPDEELGEWDGGILFEGNKRKINGRFVWQETNIASN
jgi:hypothetical protein